MTPERVAKLVGRWVRFYTQELPTPIAQRRINEIDADLHDHIEHERTHGIGERRLALGILSRMARGLTADASWRWQVRPKGNPMKALLSILSALILAGVGVAAYVYGEVDDSPGGQLFGALLVLGAIWLAVRAVMTAQRSK